ncbi:MAG: ATP-dependent DNA helicase RecG [Candidatus Moranbacteria bacterium]|nr:ATP-dependent DNA helicase RecG [Candidatus Moranbacteria bacterium]
MARITLETPLSTFPAFKKSVLTRLEKRGLSTVGDLLRHLPRTYEDYSVIRPIGGLTVGEPATVEGRVKRLSAGRTYRKHVFLTEAVIEDDTGQVRAIWFGNRFIAQTLTEGARVRLSGTVAEDGKGFLFQTPDYERASRSATHTARLIPVYPEAGGVSTRFFRWQIAEIMKRVSDIPDPVPEEILSRLHLPSLRAALRYAHLPKNDTEWQLARKRFAFDEMFLFQLKALQAKALYDTSKAVPIRDDADTPTESFLASLPFEPTDAQHRAISEILRDLEGPRPMNRLVNGDVSSGKTLVAAAAARTVARAGYQSVILAPTEVLARQHWEGLSRLFADEPFPVALLTREYRFLGTDSASKASIGNAIAAGIPKVIVGTHALLQEGIRFHDLALVVVDEQHRFGVEQRAALQSQASGLEDGEPDRIPHFLTMTATPIPRTLALAFFGDLALSVLDEMPKGRRPIETRIAKNGADREIVYDFVRKEAAKGHRTFVILPLVEESEALEDVKSATAEAERLRTDVFPDLRVGLVHGKLKAKEKEEAMRTFKEGGTDVLVATAVVEVGVDVPEATVMIIENADRFGLAQLHQFRGRIGRSDRKSHCFLFPSDGAVENARLETLEKSSSGFEVAEADLALRGPGAFFGTRQSGLPDIAMENLMNLRLVEIARSEAGDLLAADPSLDVHPLLQAELRRFEEGVHME